MGKHPREFLQPGAELAAYKAIEEPAWAAYMAAKHAEVSAYEAVQQAATALQSMREKSLSIVLSREYEEREADWERALTKYEVCEADRRAAWEEYEASEAKARAAIARATGE